MRRTSVRAERIHAHAHEMLRMFPPDSDQRHTYAGPEIWTQRDSFEQLTRTYDAEDNLRYGAAHGLRVRIDDGDVEALIARTLPRRKTFRRKSFETDLVDGRWFWIEHTVLPNGWVMTVGTDISALKHNERSLRQAHEAALLASRTDLLTGLPNRRYILELLDEGLAAGEASGGSLCAATIDFDQFKVVNDTYGHDAGDVVLRHFAQIFREYLRPGDHLGRIGGEEFLLLLADVRLPDAARLINGIRAEFPPATLADQATCRPIAFSAGLSAALPRDDRSSILYRADRALYVAKAEGRNCTRISLGMERTIPDRAPAQGAKRADRGS